MAEFAMKAAAVFWNGSAYTYDGDGDLAIPDGTEMMTVIGKSVSTLAPVPVASSISYKMMANPLQSFFDSEVFGIGNNFNNGFN